MSHRSLLNRLEQLPCTVPGAEGQVIDNICSIALVMLANPPSAPSSAGTESRLPHEANGGALREAYRQISSMRIRPTRSLPPTSA